MSHSSLTRRAALRQTLAGAAVIIGSGLYSFARERARQRATARAA